MSIKNKVNGKTKGVLLMAYGSPESVAEVGDYFTHIRRGVRPSDEFIARIEERYRAVGGKTPLLQITKETAQALQKELNKKYGEGMYKVFIGMKHWYPYIKETFEDIKKEGITEVIAIALAPHYSKMSIGGYERFINEAKGDIDVALIPHWHTNHSLVTCIVDQMKEVLTGGKQPHLIFTAHSLPEKIREWQDPYESQILETAALVASHFSQHPWSVAYQSMGQTSEPWIGPHLLEEMERLTKEGNEELLIVPIGFVSDNLEITYDIDIEAQKKAGELGVRISRPQMRNSDPRFIEALLSLI